MRVGLKNLTPVPKPSADVIERAHSLLGLMGDPERMKEPRALLAKMAEAQKANGAVFEQATAALEKIDQRETVARAAEAEATTARQQQADDAKQQQQALSERAAKLEAERKRLETFEAELDARNDNLAPREASLRRAFKGWEK